MAASLSNVPSVSSKRSNLHIIDLLVCQLICSSDHLVTNSFVQLYLTNGLTSNEYQMKRGTSDKEIDRDLENSIFSSRSF